MGSAYRSANESDPARRLPDPLGLPRAGGRVILQRARYFAAVLPTLGPPRVPISAVPGGRARGTAAPAGAAAGDRHPPTTPRPVPLLLKLRPAVSAFHDGVRDPTLLRREEPRYSLPSPRTTKPSRRPHGAVSSPPPPSSSPSSSPGSQSPGPAEGRPAPPLSPSPAAPCRAAGPGRAPRRGSAGYTWCRHKEPGRPPLPPPPSAPRPAGRTRAGRGRGRGRCRGEGRSGRRGAAAPPLPPSPPGERAPPPA